MDFVGSFQTLDLDVTWFMKMPVTHKSLCPNFLNHFLSLPPVANESGPRMQQGCLGKGMPIIYVDATQHCCGWSLQRMGSNRTGQFAQGAKAWRAVRSQHGIVIYYDNIYIRHVLKRDWHFRVSEWFHLEWTPAIKLEKLFCRWTVMCRCSTCQHVGDWLANSEKPLLIVGLNLSVLGISIPD